MNKTVIEGKLTGKRLGRGAENAFPRRKRTRWVERFDPFDIATIAFVAALVVIALCTFQHYAISNDESVQHRYGELIIAYYASGLSDQSVFNFQNLYLYGGLFDILAVGLSHVISIDPYDLRHILCALVGIGGIGAAAATARLIAGPRAALIVAIALGVCGAWYGAMFNHTKDIPFASAMIGATYFLVRIGRRLPSPRTADVLAFGLVAGAAMGMRVLGLLLVIYAGFAFALYWPRRQPNHAGSWRFVMQACARLLPALLLAYLVMILAWPWAALAPLNPIRGLLAFSDFQYSIRTVLAGHVYDMSNVPRWYVPIYILVRVPLVTLAGAALTMILLLWPRLAALTPQKRRDVGLVSLTVLFPLACQVIWHGPAFTGLRHFLFVIPPLTVLAGIGLDAALIALAARRRVFASGAVAIVAGCFLLDAVTLVRLHPYEYLFYNSAVGGLEGASRRYDLDYWFGSMPEALGKLELYLRRTESADTSLPAQVYSVAVCGDRLSFEKTVTLPQLRWDFRREWNESDFFIAPTHMNCDGDLDGEVIGTVERLGVAIGYIKDRRSLIRAAGAAPQQTTELFRLPYPATTNAPGPN